MGGSLLLYPGRAEEGFLEEVTARAGFQRESRSLPIHRDGRRKKVPSAGNCKA